MGKSTFVARVRSRCRLSASAKIIIMALITGAGTTAASPAWAVQTEEQVGDGASEQVSTAQSGSDLGAIIVTARRVEENAQRVPVTITAYSGDQLQSKAIADVTTFTRAIPGVNACCAVFNTALNTFVRGINNGAPTYFADVPVSAEGFDNLFDISSAQVLKGPQGTLFGQASNAGAFVYQPRKPGEQLGGYVSVVAGDYGRRTVEGAVDIPLLDDHLLFRIAGISAHRKGYVRDIANNVDIGNEDYWIVRPSVTIKFSDRLENYTLYQHSRAQTNGFSGLITVLDDFNFNPAQSSQNGLMVFLNGGTQAAYDALRIKALLQQRALGRYKINGLSVGCQNPAGPVNVALPITNIPYPEVACPNDYFTQDRLINTTTFELSDAVTIKNIFGYSTAKSYQGPADIDGTQLVILDYRSARQTKAVPQPKRLSDELQMQGKFGIFDLTAGFFYYRQKQNTGIVFSDFDLIALGATKTQSHNESKAVYAQTTVHLDTILPGLSFTGGLRYTKDKLQQTAYSYDPNTLTLLATTGGPGTEAGDAKFDNLSYTAGIQYQVTPQTMLFLTNSRGYSAGGFQPVVGAETYAPSVLTNFEGGIKSMFDIGSVKVRANLTGFYGKFDDVQVNVFGPVTNSANGQTTFASVIRNAAKAKVRGFEGELDFIPVEGMQLGGFVGYLNNKYTRFPSFDSDGDPVDLSSTPFLFAPKWKIGLHGNYTLPLPETVGHLRLNVDFTHRSIMVNTSVPRVPTDPTNPMTGLVCSRVHSVANGYPAEVADGKKTYVDCDPPASNLDLGLTWSEFMGKEGLTLNFMVTNVTKNISTDSGANLRAQGMVSPTPAVPRMWTLRATYDF